MSAPLVFASIGKLAPVRLTSYLIIGQAGAGIGDGYISVVLPGAAYSVRERPAPPASNKIATAINSLIANPSIFFISLNPPVFLDDQTMYDQSQVQKLLNPLVILLFMAEVTVRIPEDLSNVMRRHASIDWSGIAEEAIRKAAAELELFDAIAS